MVLRLEMRTSFLTYPHESNHRRRDQVNAQAMEHQRHEKWCIVETFLTYKKTLITKKCTKSFSINCNTLLHVSTLLDHLQGETVRCRYTMSHYTVERVCAAVNCIVSLNCKVQTSVTTTESFSLKMTQQGRNM
jgi:hypothetical protein